MTKRLIEVGRLIGPGSRVVRLTATDVMTGGLMARVSWEYNERASEVWPEVLGIVSKLVDQHNEGRMEIKIDLR